jgi:hypothetical protein
MSISGWSALVHVSDDESPKVWTIFQRPEVGKELVGDVPKGLVVQHVKARDGAVIEGRSVTVEVWVRATAG